MQLSFAKKLGLHIHKTDVGIQKIAGSRLKTVGVVIAFFQIDDKDGKSRFIKETFWLADISIDIALGMPFLIVSNLEVIFHNRELR